MTQKKVIERSKKQMLGCKHKYTNNTHMGVRKNFPG